MAAMSTRARWGSTVGLALAAVAVLPLALRPPRLTLLNAALRVDYGWAVCAAALSAALLLVAAAVVAPPRWARRVAVAAAVGAAAFGASRLSYRVETRADVVYARALTGSTSVPWAEVTRVDRGPELLVVWGRGDAQVRLDTSAFAGDQRAALERALARRIVESTLPSAAARP
jgi:hypothetical protein